MFPCEVLLSIFEHLDCQSFFRALQVCKRWNAILKEEIDSQSLWIERVSLRMLKENNERCETEVFSEVRLKEWSYGRILEEHRYYDKYHNVYKGYIFVHETYTYIDAARKVCGKCKNLLYTNPNVMESIGCRNAFCWLQLSLLAVLREAKNRKERESKRIKIK